MTIAVPAVILLSADDSELGGGTGVPWAALLVAAGVSLIAAGVALWVWTVRLFASVGRGTLAPWDPTKNIVAEGPYRHVRNPMITAVLAVVIGEACLFGSVGLLILSATFFAINHVYFIAVEEPGLERRFGEGYREYKRSVPRWLPRAAGS